MRTGVDVIDASRLPWPSSRELHAPILFEPSPRRRDLRLSAAAVCARSGARTACCAAGVKKRYGGRSVERRWLWQGTRLNVSFRLRRTQFRRNAKEKGQESRAKKLRRGELPRCDEGAPVRSAQTRFNRLFRTGRCFESRLRSRCWTSISRALFWGWWTVCGPRRTSAGIVDASRSDIATGEVIFENRGSRWR